MRRFATLGSLATIRNARRLQLVGLAVILIGLVGFWLSQDVVRAKLTEAQRTIVGVREGDFEASFILAGRDILYSGDRSEARYNEEGEIVAWEFQGSIDPNGTNTDIILYVQVVNSQITLVLIPRDIYLDAWQTRINAMYHFEGIEGLRRSVSEILGRPIDYYAVINIEIFENLVDALGGVVVDIPYRMDYVDNAAGLDIHFEPGMTYLDGADASKFIRYRNTARADLGRLDNVKRLAVALMDRLKELNVRAVTRAPELINTFFKDIETNISPALVRQLLPRAGNFELRTATLPTVGVEGEGYLTYKRHHVERFLAETFNGTERSFIAAPDATLLITNSSGAEGLAEWYRDQLLALGVPEKQILLRSGPYDPSPTRLLVTGSHWQSADFYAELLHTPKHLADQLPVVGEQAVDLELILGQDAFRRQPAGLPLRIQVLQ